MTSIRLEDDFDSYVNSQWYAETEIPNEYPAWNNIYSLVESNAEKLKSLLNDLSNPEVEFGSQLEHSRDLLTKFYSHIKSKDINQSWLLTVQSYFNIIDRVSNSIELFELFAEFHTMGINCGFNIGLGHSIREDKLKMIDYLNFGYVSLSLPDRDYYLNPDVKFENYVKHLNQLRDKLNEFTIDKLLASVTDIRIRTSLDKYQFYL